MNRIPTFSRPTLATISGIKSGFLRIWEGRNLVSKPMPSNPILFTFDNRFLKSFVLRNLPQRIVATDRFTCSSERRFERGELSVSHAIV